MQLILQFGVIYVEDKKKMKHLTLADRSEIEHGLRNHRSFHAIAQILGVARSTIQREVLLHAKDSEKGAKGRVSNRCIYRRQCDRHYVCRSCITPMQNRKCSSCSKCNVNCLDFREECCERLDHPPYVCNGCTREGICVLRKKFYLAEIAQDEYEKLLVSARTGAAITPEERTFLHATLDAGLKKGQSLHHMVQTAPDLFTVSERTLYTYIHTGVLPGIGILDLPVVPKMKPRRKKGSLHKINPHCKEGRGIEDYRTFCAENKDFQPVEIDSVLGTVGGKLLLTINFDCCALMLAFIRDANTSQSVIDIFDSIERTLGTVVFKRLFPVILTDNGTEFSNPDALETSVLDGNRRTRIFYCDPYSAYQKPNVENNHENLRKIFPKGKSMDWITQDKVNLAVSHLNSMLRGSLNNIPAIRLFEQFYGTEILDKLDIHLIDPHEVCLTPDLIKR